VGGKGGLHRGKKEKSKGKIIAKGHSYPLLQIGGKVNHLGAVDLREGLKAEGRNKKCRSHRHPRGRDFLQLTGGDMM